MDRRVVHKVSLNRWECSHSRRKDGHAYMIAVVHREAILVVVRVQVRRCRLPTRKVAISVISGPRVISGVALLL